MKGFRRNRIASRNEKKEEFPYLFNTRDGYKIIKWGMKADGELVVIIERELMHGIKDYPVGDGYSARTGTWCQGRNYMGPYEKALEIFDHYTKYKDFDPYKQRDLDFMRSGRFNYNFTDRRYLEEHDYREPGFDTYRQFDHDFAGFRELPSREEWSSFREKKMIQNANVKNDRKAQIRLGQCIVDIPEDCDSDLRRYLCWFFNSPEAVRLSRDTGIEEVESILDDYDVGYDSRSVFDYYRDILQGAC